MSLLANAFVGRVGDLMTDTPAADIARAEGLVDQALAAQPRSAFAHFVKGKVLRTQNRLEEAILEIEASLALNRNSVWPLHYLGLCKLATGSIEEVIPLEQQAIRLSPRELRIGWWYHTIGHVHLLQSRVDEAIAWLEKARSDIPAAPFVHAPRLRLRAQWRDGARVGRTRRSPEAQWRRSLLEPRALAGFRKLGCAKNARPCGSHLCRWSSAGRHAGGMTAPTLLNHASEFRPHSLARFSGASIGRAL